MLVFNFEELKVRYLCNISLILKYERTIFGYSTSIFILYVSVSRPNRLLGIMRRIIYLVAPAYLFLLESVSKDHTTLQCARNQHSLYNHRTLSPYVT